MLNMLLSPALGSQGIDYTPAKLQRTKAQRPRTDAEEEAREARLLRSLASSPISVRTVRTSEGAGEAGADG